jgi:8-oxo-dGTP pyrophosphatase MutT (NUDIX family)
MCALRETKEEVGLTLTNVRLVGIYSGPAKGDHSDSLKFLFAADTLTDSDIARISLQADELEEYRFLPIEDALPLLSGSLRASIPLSIEAMQKGTVRYIEG